MEGITGFVFRNGINEFFKGSVDKFYSPFVTPHLKRPMTKRELEDVNPANRIDTNSNGAIILPIGPITSKTSGRTINIRLVPSLINSVIGIEFVTDMYPKMENIPNATKIS